MKRILLRIRNLRARGVTFALLLASFFFSWPTAGATGAFCLGPIGRGPRGVAEESPLFRSEKVAVYVVKEGDRLGDLARRFYGDAEKAWMIEDANGLKSLKPGQVLVIPLRPINPGGLTPHGYQVIPILTYHHFSTECTSALCLPIEDFARQMSFLQEEGYRVITMRQVLEFLRYKAPLPRKAVAITIDDGYSSVYNLAYPVLKSHNFNATLFIYTDFIGNSPNALSWQQLKEMSKAGFEVEAHTVSHADLTLEREGETETSYLERIRQELEIPRKLIREQLGQEALWLAYPYGRFNSLVIRMASEAGYLGAVTVTRGANPFFANPFKIKRDQIMNSENSQPFEELLTTFRGELSP